MTMMARGMSMLGRQLATAAGVTIVYTRLAALGSPITIDDAVPGKSAQASQAGPGEAVTRHVFTERDYLIPVDSLGHLPAIGDRVVETIEGTSYTFEVRPQNGLKEWDWSDNLRTRYRVRTKRV